MLAGGQQIEASPAMSGANGRPEDKLETMRNQ
jgi:hypothetical protein